MRGESDRHTDRRTDQRPMPTKLSSLISFLCGRQCALLINQLVLELQALEKHFYICLTQGTNALLSCFSRALNFGRTMNALLNPDSISSKTSDCLANKTKPLQFMQMLIEQKKFEQIPTLCFKQTISDRSPLTSSIKNHEKLPAKYLCRIFCL